MLTENGLEVDLERVDEVLRRADVLAVGFTLFPERLLVDTRTTADEGPLVTIVEPVQSVQERYLWLGQHRGAFGAPEAFSFFVWPHTVRNLVERDILAALRTRLAEASSLALPALDDSLRTLTGYERAAVLRLMAGEGEWQTLWPRPAGED